MYILVVLIYSFSTSTLQMQEFSSRDNCDRAKTFILQAGQRDIRAAECVPK